MKTYNLDNHFENGSSVESPIWALFLQAAEVGSESVYQHLVRLIALHHRDEQRETLLNMKN